MIDRPQRTPQSRITGAEISPKKLLAEIQRLLAERERAKKALEAAQRDTQTAVAERDDLGRGRGAAPAALRRERAEFTNYKRRTADERQAMLGLANEGLISKVLTLADD